jgi:hypothetical protein
MNIFKEAHHTEDSENDLYLYNCPACCFTRIESNFNYCPYCGKGIYWIESVEGFEEKLLKKIRARELMVVFKKFNPDKLGIADWTKKYFPEEEDFTIEKG